MTTFHLSPGEKGNSERHYVGYDVNEEYVKLAERRIKEFSLAFNAPRLFEFGVKKDDRNGETARNTV